MWDWFDFFSFLIHFEFQFNFDFKFNSFSKKKKKKKLVVKCPYISNEGNVEWDETIANGEGINKNCPLGYIGSMFRVCLQDGTIGNWSPVLGSCESIFYHHFWNCILFR